MCYRPMSVIRGLIFLLLTFSLGPPSPIRASEYCDCTGKGEIVSRRDLLSRWPATLDVSRADSTRDAIERILFMEPATVHCVGAWGGDCPDPRLPLFIALPDTAYDLGDTIFGGTTAEFEALVPGVRVEFQYSSLTGMVYETFRVERWSWIQLHVLPPGEATSGADSTGPGPLTPR